MRPLAGSKAARVHYRTFALRLAVVACSFALGSCDSDEPDGPAAPSRTTSAPADGAAEDTGSDGRTPSTVVLGRSVELRADAAGARVSAGGRAGRRPAAVAVSITQVDNPNRQGIDLTVDAETRAGSRVAVGQVSPFPPDRTATFRLPVPRNAQEVLAAEGASLVVTMRSSIESLPIDPALRLVLDVAVSD